MFRCDECAYISTSAESAVDHQIETGHDLTNDVDGSNFPHEIPAGIVEDVSLDALEASWRSDEIVALMGRYSTGIGVQLLYRPADGACFVTVVTADATETFPVDAADALEAFYHPFVYGCALSV